MKPADEFYMRCAIELGEKARLLSPPNPWVGCVIVRDNMIIAEGFTQPPGQAHAEAVALCHAQSRAEGATAYVTLEPCAHHGRTPPCSQALITAKVKRVVIAILDPDPLVSGKGVNELQAAGIEVTLGVGAREAEESLRPYLHHRQTGKAYCLIKTAMSLDGRVAAKDHTSQWITEYYARVDVHQLRAFSQAIVVGSGTALADAPALTVRHTAKPLAPPLRILIDRQGRVPATGPLFDRSAPTLVITSPNSPLERREAWQKAEASIYLINDEEPFDTILSYLGKLGIIQVMIEGGPTLQSSILHQKQCQQLVAYVGPMILGEESLPAFMGLGIHTLSGAIPLSLGRVKQFDNTLRIDYFIK